MTIKKLQTLRSTLLQKQLDGFLVPRADAWPGEFVSNHAERLKWLSGFTGSAGMGIVLENKAVVLTDGRYTLQVAVQINSEIWESGDITKVSPDEWLLEHAAEESRIGFDARLHSPSDIKKWEENLDKKEIELVPLFENPLDDLWEDQPDLPKDPVFLFPEKFAGAGVVEKIDRVLEVLQEKELSQYFFTMPDSIAWLLNVRGNDVRHTPVPLSYGLLEQDGTFDWFIDPEKVPEAVRKELGAAISIHPLAKMDDVLKDLKGTTGLDPKRSSYYFSQILPDIVEVEDPCILLKACKNEAEQKAIRQTHVHDGQALIEFHRWLKDNQDKNLDELNVEKKLEEFRKANGVFISPSFDTIAGYEANGAIIHYRATEQTNKVIKGEGLFLIDSGAQYLGEDYAGTTDVTRTYIIGKASNEQKHHYTTVLKAHITVANARFPYGTTGVQIDALARAVMWQEGFDFAHGLGHGVGCFLNVHEEATRLSPYGDSKLEVGMLLSNEPGLYLEGQYGIRIENLMLVQKTGEKDILGRDLLCFETVTLAPYDNDLIDFNLLNGAEIEWLQAYYEKIEAHLTL